MIDREALQTAIKTLRSQGWRTSLTILAIVLGITAIITLVSLGEGLNSSITKQFESMGTETIVVMPGKGFVESAFAHLSTDDVKTIETVRGVQFATEIYITAQQLEYKNQHKTRLLIGVDPSKLIEMGFIGLINMGEGRLITTRDSTAILTGPTFAEKTFDRKVNVNSEIKINDEQYRVVGTLEKATNSFYGSFMDNAVIMTSDQLKVIQPQLNPTRIFVKLEPGIDSEDAKTRITHALELAHHQTDFQVMSPDQVAQTAGSIIGLVQLILVGIAAISLVVGGVGVMNTMYMSVTERTTEVGIMKAIGASNPQIRDIFLLESIVIGTVGGLIGTLLGIGLATLITIGAQLGGFDLEAVLSFQTIIGAVLFSMILCLVFGYLPAKQAAELDPVDAIRKNS